MAWFEASRESTAVVDATPQQVWDVLADPDQVVAMTPFLQRIIEDGEHWHWQMISMSRMGMSFSPAFTVRMSFDEPHCIEFVHDPPEGVRERAGADGWYRLREVDAGTELSIALTVKVDLPLPRHAKPAVRTAMKGVLAEMGRRFGANLETHLAAQR